MYNFNFELEKYANTVNFFESNDKDINITDIGFNCFKYLNVFDFFRKQSTYTIHFVIKGKGKLFFNNVEHTISANTFFILPPNENFKYLPIKEDPWSYIWIGFSGETAQKLYDKIITQEQTNVIPLQNAEKGLYIKKVVEEFLVSSTMNYYGTLSLFYFIYDQLTTYPTQKNNNQNLFVKNAIECIDINVLNCEFTVESLCNMIHVSHSYLCNIFKKTYNISIKTYITNLRLEKARELLSSKSLKIKEISYLVGYKDEVNFIKAYRKKYKASPTNDKFY